MTIVVSLIGRVLQIFDDALLPLDDDVEQETCRRTATRPGMSASNTAVAGSAGA